MRKTNEAALYTLLKGLLLAVAVLSFWPYLHAAGLKGIASGDYSHVFVIPLIAIGVYVRNLKTAATPWPRGVTVALLAGGTALRLVGAWLGLPLVAVASFPPLFIGLCAGLFGAGAARRVVFPALFLLFAFGFVTDILLALFVRYLVLMSTGAAYDMVSTVLPGRGPYILIGNTITVLPNIRFDVIDACSGVRGMLALFVIGSLIGYARKLAFRPALRFLALLTAGSIAANQLRIGLTIVASLLLRERIGHDAIHDALNYVVFGALILVTPLVAERTRRPLRLGWVEWLAVAMVLAHAGQWHLRAAQGNSRFLIGRGADGATEVRIEVEQDGVPRALHGAVSPRYEGRRRWRWVVASAFVHSNLSHLAVNVGLLWLIGRAVRRELPWPWALGALLGGQLAAALTGWLTWTPPEGTVVAVVTGASGAVAGLFGAYLVLCLPARRRRRLQAGLLFVAFVAGLWLTTRQIRAAYVVSFAGHMAGLLAGLLAGGLAVITKK